MKKRKVNAKSLANLRPAWRKGEVPNPNGINRKRPITDHYWEVSEEAMPEALVRRFNKKCGLALLKLGDTWARAIAVRVSYESVMDGAVRAMKEMREATEGRAPQRLEITGPESKEITLRVVYDRESRGSGIIEESLLVTTGVQRPQ